MQLHDTSADHVCQVNAVTVKLMFMHALGASLQACVTLASRQAGRCRITMETKDVGIVWMV